MANNINNLINSAVKSGCLFTATHGQQKDRNMPQRECKLVWRKPGLKPLDDGPEIRQRYAIDWGKQRGDIDDLRNRLGLLCAPTELVLRRHNNGHLSRMVPVHRHREQHPPRNPPPQLSLSPRPVFEKHRDNLLRQQPQSRTEGRSFHGPKAGKEKSVGYWNSHPEIPALEVYSTECLIHKIMILPSDIKE